MFSWFKKESKKVAESSEIPEFRILEDGLGEFSVQRYKYEHKEYRTIDWCTSLYDAELNQKNLQFIITHRKICKKLNGTNMTLLK
jgi:hypothetical protein